MKKIRSNFVKESLLDYENLANTLKENTSDAVKSLLDESVRETYSKLLSEANEDEYEEEEVEDTNPVEGTEEMPNPTEEVPSEEGTEEVPNEPMEAEEGAAEEAEEDPSAVEGMANATEEADGEGWDEFDKYKVPGSDDVYNFSGAKDEDIVKVYKLLKDDDEVLVNVDKDSNKVELKDNQTGAEYILDLGSDDDDDVIEDEADDMDAEGELEDNNEDMNESRIFEIALNEYDSNVGYTDNYQSKDVMTNPGMSEPGKNVNDWDKGIPHDSAKPWSGKKGDKKENQPFDGEKGKKVEESYIFEIETDTVGDIEECDEPTVEEGAGRYGMVQKHSVGKKHVGTNDNEDDEPDVSHNLSTSEHGFKAVPNANESRMIAAHNRIVKENKQLKNILGKFKNVLTEAAVTNKNLGQIIKLISENSTTKAEKQEIIARFGKEANSIESSDKLYESINRELKKNGTMNINEDRQFTTSGSKMINETQIYQSKDLIDSLDLMHRICK